RPVSSKGGPAEYIRSDMASRARDRPGLEARAILRGAGCNLASGRPAHELAAAVGAYECERVGASAAEGALIAADIRLSGWPEGLRALLAFRFHREPARHRRRIFPLSWPAFGAPGTTPGKARTSSKSD